VRSSLKTKLRRKGRGIEVHRDLGLVEAEICISYSGGNSSLSTTSTSRTHHRHIIHIVYSHQVHGVQVHVHGVLVDVVRVLRVACVGSVACRRVSEGAVVAPERLVELEECHARWLMDPGSMVKIIPVPILLLCHPPLPRDRDDLLRGL